MSEYSSLGPLSANSVMRIHPNSEKMLVFFNNIITYYYYDVQEDPDEISYKRYMENEENYNKEIGIYWENLQTFLDEEENIINDKEVQLDVVHTNIMFLDDVHPMVQWIVEFKGNLLNGENKYENIIEREILKYPIHSLYFFSSEFKVKKVQTSLEFFIHPNKRGIEYFGQEKDDLEGYESIIFEFID